MSLVPYSKTPLSRSSASRALSTQSPILLWIDGVLDPARMETLMQESLLIDAVQHPNYVLCRLSGNPDGMRIRQYLDPHVFVLQRDAACTMLEINFNPRPDQIQALREFVHRVKLLTQ